MFTLKSRGRILTTPKPLVMGIINATPDSFFELSRTMTEDSYKSSIDQMIKDGADIIDIGGQSSKPGAVEITENEELARVIGPINYITSRYPNTWISIDTTRSGVAHSSIMAGAHIVNDVSAGNMDKAMIPIVSDLRVPFVCTHMQGIPSTMQLSPNYENVTEEILLFFEKKINECLDAGIENLVLDPGFGFGKTINHNYEILKHLKKFNAFGFPILVGFSRKSMIYKLLNITPEEALNGTSILNTFALLNGASIIRVHDVKEAKQAITIINKII